MTRPRIDPVLALALFTAPAGAQLANDWLEYTPGPPVAGGAIVSASDVEVDFAWGDLDRDGDVDLVCARKQPFTTAGKRRNLLLANEGGVLVDRTAAFAAASDVPGDLGFLTPTNDRDALIADVDGDGWADVVTATTLSDGDSKAVGHPRVYRNLGPFPGAGWIGLRYEAARIPQLFDAATGAPANPRFNEVAAGDLNGDGFPELYFVDHDGPGAAVDLNDRLLANDGSGFFSDGSAAMTGEMLLSAYGTSVAIVDVDTDGLPDVVKSTSLSAPQHVRVSYNDAASPGTFTLTDVAHDGSAYHVDAGDLNADGRPDLVIAEPGLDRYRHSSGIGASGVVSWGSAQTFHFLSGGDDGFAGNVLISDLDEDGRPDVLICDVDVDIPGYSRRAHLYHNLGGPPGLSVVLQEERESAGAGWVGAKGLLEADLVGTFDAAVFDLDGDGDRDLVLGRAAGTSAWLSQVVETALDTDVDLVSVSAGGVQTLSLSAGTSHAAEPYLLLGTTSGTSPGIGVDGFVIPLTIDAYFLHTLASPGAPPLSGSAGILGASGEATAAFSMPAGSDPALVGLLAHHAFATWSPVAPAGLRFVSPAASVQLVP